MVDASKLSKVSKDPEDHPEAFSQQAAGGKPRPGMQASPKADAIPKEISRPSIRKSCGFGELSKQNLR